MGAGFKRFLFLPRVWKFQATSRVLLSTTPIDALATTLCSQPESLQGFRRNGVIRSVTALSSGGYPYNNGLPTSRCSLLSNSVEAELCIISRPAEKFGVRTYCEPTSISRGSGSFPAMTSHVFGVDDDRRGVHRLRMYTSGTFLFVRRRSSLLRRQGTCPCQGRGV